MEKYRIRIILLIQSRYTIMEYLLEFTCDLLIREINNVSTVKCLPTLVHNQAHVALLLDSVLYLFYFLKIDINY